MATIKSLLDAALKASSTNAYVSSSASGTVVATFTASSTWDNEVWYTPPADGILYISSAYAYTVFVSQNSAPLYLDTKKGSSTYFHSSFVPVSKGATARIVIVGATNGATVTFYPCKGQA